MCYKPGMRTILAVAFALIAGGACRAQKHQNVEPFPSEVVIGRDSFIDIGPPFNYYDLTFLHADGASTDVERVSLTPPADMCYPRAEIAVAHVRLDESLSSVLQSTNPCSIPEKKLDAELKRRKKTRVPVFSGMNVSMQARCADGVRVIRAEILDRDIFGDQSKTPQYTSWSRTLFDKLDKATGESPWDKPVFPLADAPSTVPATSQSEALRAIAEGKFDTIFGNTSDRPSELYRSAQSIPRKPFIELTTIEPVRPATYVDPVYPPIAKAARVEGTVDFHLVIGANGSPESVTIDSGPKMLWQAATDAIAKWKFLPEDSGKTVHGVIRFGLNCRAVGN